MKKLLIPLLCLLPIAVFAQDFELGLPIGHTSEVVSAKFSSDGKLIVTASDDGTAKIFDGRSGKLLHSLQNGNQTINSVNFSPDSNKVLTSSDDNTSRLYDVISGKLLYTLEGHDDSVNLAIFSPKGDRIATTSSDRTVKIYNTKTGKLIHSLEEHVYEDYEEIFFEDNIYASFNSDGSKIATASYSGNVKLYDVISGKQLFSFEDHESAVYCLKFSPDDSVIVTASRDNTVKIYDINKGELLNSLNEHKALIKEVNFNSKGNRIVTSSYDNTAKVYDVSTGKLLFSLDDHKSYVTSAIFSPDGHKIITASEDNTVKLYNSSNGKMIFSFEDHTSAINSIDYSADNNRIITASYDNTVKIYNAINGKLLKSIENRTSPVNFASFNLKNTKVIAGYNNTVNIYDISSGNIIQSFKCINSTINYTSLSPDESKILLALKDGTAKLFDSTSGKLLYSLDNHIDSVSYVSFNSDGSKIITSSYDGTAKLYETSKGQEIYTFDKLYGGNYSGSVYAAIFSPNDDKIAIAHGKWVDIYETKNNTLLYTIKDHSSNITSINFSFNGSKLATASQDKTTNLYEADSGKLLLSLENHSADLTSINFSNDEKKIITSSIDKSINVWDISSGNILNSFKGHLDIVNSAKFSLNNKYIISASLDGSVSIWDTVSEKKLISQYIFNENKPFWLLPNGNYFASKESASKLYYKKGIESIGFEQLDVKFNRPDKVLKVLGDISGERNRELVIAYKNAWEKRIRKLDIDTTNFRQGLSVPESKIYNSSKITYEQRKSKLKLHIKGSDNIYNLDRFNVWINEVPIFGSKGISLKSKNINTIDTTLTVKLSRGENRIETSILNANGIESYRQPLYVNYTPKKEIKEKLYFVGIGVDKYQEEGNNLNYSVKDIKDLSIQLKEKYGSQIQIDTLFNQNVTVSNIKKLKKQLSKSKVDDKVIISFSGHGLLSKDLDYYLAMHDVNFDSPEENGLPYEDLEYLLDGIPSRQKLLLIDACHSGEVDKEEVKSIHKVEKLKEGLKGSIGITTKKPKLGIKNSFELMKELFNNVDRATGATVISAAAGTEFAQERGNLKNGVFTYCILNQLKEKETISVSELKQLVSEQVKEITNGLQQPTSRNETIENDWKVW